jgi:hypothetical protein
MGVCETCGASYAKSFKIIINSETHEFDSLECAIQGIAPTCPHCGCRVIGHGVDSDGLTFCSHHCLAVKKRIAFAEESPPV